MTLIKLLLGLNALTLSFAAQAQSTGLLTYGLSPFVPIAVPVSSMLLLPLSLGVLLIAYLALRKPAGKQLIGFFALTIGLGLFMVSGLQIQQATAQASIQLSNPEGGTVTIPQASALYVNTSGVPLEIESVEAPPLCSSTAPADECEPELTLLNGQSCSTEFDCPEPQTITYTSPVPTDAVINGTPYEVAATASSGLPVSFTTASTACSVAGSSVSFDAEGFCVIDANQAGNDDFLPAPPVQQSFEISKQTQTITYNSTAPVDAVINGTPYEVTATASSGLPVSFTTASTTCSIVGSMVSFDAEGSCVIDANQPGNEDFLPAPQVQQSFEISKQTQTITFTSTPPADALVNGGPYEVTATASSGLPVSFTTASTACSIVGSMVSFDAEGSCVIDANQPGNEDFLPAPPVQQSFEISRQTQSITFTSTPPAGALVNSGPYQVNATASSGLPVSFTSASAACSVTGSTVSLDAEGTCVIDANQPGNDEFLPAPQVQQSFEISRRTQSITLTSMPPANAVVNGGPYEVTATASSGLPVSFSSASTTCSVVGATVSFDAEGTCVIDADQSGNGEFLPAMRVQQSFTIAAPRITFEPAGPICSFGSPPTGCNAQPMTEFGISPACDASGWTVTVDWDQGADGNVDQQDVGTQFSPIDNTYAVQGAYPFGGHLFRVRAEDACSTVLTTNIPFEIIDCKAPSPICINGLGVDLMPTQDPSTGIAQVWANDIIASPVQDCSPPVEYSINPAGEVEDRDRISLELSCDDVGVFVVEIYGWDEVDNREFCKTSVLVQDPMDICPP